MSAADKLAALREAATTGPWRADSHGWVTSPAFSDGEEPIIILGEGDDPDVDLVCLLVNAAPALEALVRAAEAAVGAAEYTAPVWQSAGLPDPAAPLRAALAELDKLIR